jgi:hypothetical protein
MTIKRKQMIEEEIKSLQGELNSLIRQEHGFLMAPYADWYNAMKRATARQWTFSTNGSRFYLDKAGKQSITIELMNNYGYAICTRNERSQTMNTPAELLKYIEDNAF